MWNFIQFLENSSFAALVRETPSVLAYPTVLAFHTFGMSILVGLSSMIALRVLGFAPGLPLAPMEKFFRLIVIGFWVNAVTGVVLTILQATTFLVNPDFYVKLTAIAGAVVSLRLLRKAVFGDRESLDVHPLTMRSKIWASTMLGCWIIAITAGRLTAYAGYTIRWTAPAVLIFLILIFFGRSLGARVLSSHRVAPEHPVVNQPSN